MGGGGGWAPGFQGLLNSVAKPCFPSRTTLRLSAGHLVGPAEGASRGHRCQGPPVPSQGPALTRASRPTALRHLRLCPPRSSSPLGPDGNFWVRVWDPCSDGEGRCPPRPEVLGQTGTPSTPATPVPSPNAASTNLQARRSRKRPSGPRPLLASIGCQRSSLAQPRCRHGSKTRLHLGWRLLRKGEAGISQTRPNQKRERQPSKLLGKGLAFVWP